MKKIIFASLLVLIINTVAQATTYYVLGGASGNGTSWSSAYSDVSRISTISAGDTIWIGAGTYTGGFYVNVPNVSIVRATAANHGTSTGWSNAYDGQVTFNPSCGTTFLSMDSGSSSGFLIDGVMVGSTWKFVVNGIRGSLGGNYHDEGSSGSTIRGIEFNGNADTSCANAEDGLRIMGGTGNIYEHLYIHDFQQNGSVHNDGVQAPNGTNMTWRYNIFKNNGQHLFLGDCTWNSSYYVTGLNVYYNVFYNDALGELSYDTLVFKGVKGTIHIDNNTFAVHTSQATANGGVGPRIVLLDDQCNTLGSNFYFRNNILYDSAIGDATSGNHSNNLYYGGQTGTASTETGMVKSDPLFTNYSGGVYTLQAGSPAASAGINSGYTQDIFGTAVSSSPSIGAYQYGSGGTPGVRTPSSPTLQ